MISTYILPEALHLDVICKRNGAVARVVGYGEKTVKPPVAYGMEPGVYVDWDYPTIEMRPDADGERIYLSGETRCGNGMIQGSIHRQSLQLADGQPLEGRPVLRLRDLPDTKFWHGDLVELPDGRESAIHCIYYRCLEADAADREAYEVLDPDGDNFRKISFEESALKLVRRGNLFRHYHGQNLEFPSVADEIIFHATMGWVDKVSFNGRDSVHHEVALEGVMNGTADIIWDCCARLAERDYGNSVTAYVLKDRGLAARYRDDFLARMTSPDGPQYAGWFAIDHAVCEKLRLLKTNTPEEDREIWRANEAAAKAAGGPDVIIRFVF